MLLSVIIVSYNTAELTLAAIDSVISEASNSPKLQTRTEIFVVDNNSSDDSVSHLKHRAKSSPIPLHVLAQSENLGFARANNLATEHAKGQLLFYFNSDATLENGSLEKLVNSFLQNPIHDSTANDSLSTTTDRVGMVAAKLLNKDHSDQYQGGDLPSLMSLVGHQLLIDDIPLLGQFMPSTQHTGQRGSNQVQTTKDLQPKGWVAGTALMVRRELIDEVGAFDPNIFMYGEDMEWCLRAKKHHWDVCINQFAPVVHVGSASSTPKNAIAGEMKAYLYIWAKHFPAWQFPLVKGILKLGCLLRWALFGTMGQHDKANLYKELLNLA